MDRTTDCIDGLKKKREGGLDVFFGYGTLVQVIVSVV